MGVVRWLIRIDPATWETACRALKTAPPRDEAGALAFLEQFDRAEKKDVASGFRFVEDEESRACALNSLLETAVTEETWEMDKALDNGLNRVLRCLPGGADVHRAIVDFGALKLDPPAGAASVDGGLLGACTADALRPSAQWLARFQSMEAIEEAARAPIPPLLGFIHRENKAKKAVEILRDEYMAHYWGELGKAIQETVAKGHHLGMGISP